MNRFAAIAKNLFLTIKYHHRFSRFNLDHFFDRKCCGKIIFVSCFCNFFSFILPSDTSPAAIQIVQLSLPGATSSTSQSTSINELMQDGLLWGVPKKRRTAEKRLHRRFGVENYPDSAKILRTRNDLVVCERCGDHHEYYAICPTCYSKVKEETKRMQDQLRQQTNPLQPKEKDILFRYENEKNDESFTSQQQQQKNEFFQIIDIDHPRPQWFSRNLMIKSTGSTNYNPRDVIMDPKDLISNNKKDEN